MIKQLLITYGSVIILEIIMFNHEEFIDYLWQYYYTRNTRAHHCHKDVSWLKELLIYLEGKGTKEITLAKCSCRIVSFVFHIHSSC